MGLSLYQQLCNLARMALGSGDSRDAAHPHTLAMDHLWKIALRANSTGECFKIMVAPSRNFILLKIVICVFVT